jgi:gliding motility-associated-like protein
MGEKILNHTILILLLIITDTHSVLATHNRAGEITYVQKSDLTITATLVVYTKTESIAADRDTITIYWGDGSFTNVKRANGRGEELANSVKKNIYISDHTYPGRGSYIISMIDPNRIADILNVDPPNSINVPFYIQSTITLFNTTFQGINHSPVLLKAPIDIACLGQIFIHNPSAYDGDGDSLSFKLVSPLMDFGTPVPNYLLPNQINPGLNNDLSLNPQTGTLIWNSPQRPGEYNVAIEISEFRRGIKIGSVIRDMQILVLESCRNNSPPVIFGPRDTCVVAGTLLELEYRIEDLNAGTRGGKIKLETGGAPFTLENPATATFSPGFNDPPGKIQIKWQTDCSHVQKEYYTLFISATDDYYDTTGLSSIMAIRIKITAPAPLLQDARQMQNGIELNWTQPYACDDGDTEFRGFSVWRSTQSQNIINDTCLPGLERSSYERIAYLVQNIKNNFYYYPDTTALSGINYCYRVQAEFSKLSPSGFPFNFTPSLASNELCGYISNEKPIILNVDVIQTHETSGQIKFKWTKPDFNRYDTLIHTPPYRISILRSTDKNPFSEIKSYNTSHIKSFTDTLLIDSLINTKFSNFTYKINILSSDGYQNFSDTAESVFIRANIRNRAIELVWNEKTPWTNYRYVILKRLSTNPISDSIDFTSQKNYTDRNVIFGNEYCYIIKSVGAYGIEFFEKPLFNHSQELCIVMKDTSPPCCPRLVVEGPCVDGGSGTKDEITLKWNNPNLTCDIGDVKGYKIYFSLGGRDPELLETIDDPTIVNYIHRFETNEPLCYRINSIDTSGKECIQSPLVCVEYCPEYILPNTFTPDQDGFNDYFKPRSNRYIQSVEFIVTNRWGQEVFQTNDPEINWDGKDQNGKDLHDGVYYYLCKINPFPGQTADIKRSITGFIEIIRKR